MFKVIVDRISVVVCIGRYNKISQTGWLINDRNLLLTVLEAGRPRSRHQQDCLLARACFLIHGWPLATGPLHDGRRRVISGTTFIRY